MSAHDEPRAEHGPLPHTYPGYEQVPTEPSPQQTPPSYLAAESSTLPLRSRSAAWRQAVPSWRAAQLGALGLVLLAASLFFKFGIIDVPDYVRVHLNGGGLYPNDTPLTQLYVNLGSQPAVVALWLAAVGMLTIVMPRRYVVFARVTVVALAILSAASVAGQFVSWRQVNKQSQQAALEEISRLPSSPGTNGEKAALAKHFDDIHLFAGPGLVLMLAGIVLLTVAALLAQSKRPMIASNAYPAVTDPQQMSYNFPQIHHPDQPSTDDPLGLTVQSDPPPPSQQASRQDK